MATLDKYLGELKALRLKYPVDALENPNGITGEIFGIHIGVVKGLKMAENLLEQVLAKEAGLK